MAGNHNHHPDSHRLFFLGPDASIHSSRRREAPQHNADNMSHVEMSPAVAADRLVFHLDGPSSANFMMYRHLEEPLFHDERPNDVVPPPSNSSGYSSTGSSIDTLLQGRREATLGGVRPPLTAAHLNFQDFMIESDVAAPTVYDRICRRDHVYSQRQGYGPIPDHQHDYDTGRGYGPTYDPSYGHGHGYGPADPTFDFRFYYAAGRTIPDSVKPKRSIDTCTTDEGEFPHAAAAPGARLEVTAHAGRWTDDCQWAELGI